MINAFVKTQHKRRMHFMTSAPNLGGQLTPLPRPGLPEPLLKHK